MSENSTQIPGQPTSESTPDEQPKSRRKYRKRTNSEAHVPDDTLQRIDEALKDRISRVCNIIDAVTPDESQAKYAKGMVQEILGENGLLQDVRSILA